MLNSKTFAATAAILISVLSASAFADPFAVFNTGEDASGNALPDGSADPHYSWQYGDFSNYLGNYNGASFTGTPAYVPYNQVWGLGDASSAAISYGTDDHSGYVPFTFRTSFDLTGFLPTTASIDLWFYTDDQGEIALNGVLIPATFRQYAGPTEFVLNSGFIDGVNTLDFLSFNEGGDGGIYVKIVGTDAQLPEPASLALLGVGLAGVGLARRKRR